jgi:ppGpp synthetase/RelA/SpoT-type nucleotidyltranferase
LSRQYEEALPKLQARTEKMRALCLAILEAEDVPHYLESRTKKLDSFLRKASELGLAQPTAIEEMHDVSGLRIIVASLEDVARVESILRDSLEVDSSRSTKKGTEFLPDQFGYKSDHLICRVDDTLKGRPEWRNGEGWVEVQIRSACQHAWAQVDRLVRYKTTSDLPEGLERRLFSLAAVLEVCDSEIESILGEWRGSLENASESIRGDPQIALSEDVFAAFIESSERIGALATALSRSGIRIRGLGHLSRDIRIMESVGISTIGELKSVVEDSSPWNEDFFIRFFDELKSAGSSADSLERNALATLIVIATCADRLDAEKLRSEYGYGLAWAAISAASE